MGEGLTLVTAPAEEPVTVDEAKLHLRVDQSDEDALVSSLIVAARRYAETFTRRAFVTQTWALALPGFPRSLPIALPLPPLQSVDEIRYVDSDEAAQVLDAGNYLVETGLEPGLVARAWGATWPDLSCVHPAPVTVEFTAGYGDPADVPATIKQAILAIVGQLFEHRETTVTGTIQEVPFSAQALLQTERFYRFR